MIREYEAMQVARKLANKNTRVRKSSDLKV